MDAHIKHNEQRHAQIVISELGIIYEIATPQSLYDQWWFWNCKNIPDKLPEYISKLDLNPLDCIGNGLGKADAELVFKKQNET